MPENDQCSVEGCARTAIAALDVRSFCSEHFIFTCDAQLEAYRQRLREHRLGEVSPESAWRFIQDCMREANRLELSEKNLDDLQRARLLNIILSAADLGRHVRRGPRRALSIPVRLCLEKLDDPWQEETETVLISYYGALVRCQRPFEVDERLRVIRRDDGRQTEARGGMVSAQNRCPAESRH